jgi:uncharacterized RDD family membrane protein YckC
MDTQPAPIPAGLMRRLAAMLYDTLLLAAIAMVATGLLLPLTGGKAITAESNPALGAAYRALLVGIVVAFYGLFWTRRGQTLGMQSWRLRVEREDGRLLGWGDVLRRLAAALLSLLPLGLGFLWILLDRRKRAWHDRLSGTRVVLVPKHQRPKRPA